MAIACILSKVQVLIPVPAAIVKQELYVLCSWNLHMLCDSLSEHV